MFSAKGGVAAQASARASPAPPSSSKPAQQHEHGTGKHIMTQVVYGIQYLKVKDKPMTFDDILSHLSIQNLTEQQRLTIEHILKLHEKVTYDKSGFNGKGSFRFRPTHNVRSTEDLEWLLQSQTTAQGIQVKELKDGWFGAIDEIEALEAEGKALVTRNKKDSTPRMVWPNDPSLIHHVDTDFQTLWHKVKLPANASDLRRELIDFGLTPTSQVKAPVAQVKPKEKKRKAPRKGGRTTNTHMQNILKDFSHLRRA